MRDILRGRRWQTHDIPPPIHIGQRLTLGYCRREFGACAMNVYVSGDLKADLSDASKVNYSGNPRNVFRKVSGASSVTGD